MDPLESAILPAVHHLQAFLVCTAIFSGITAYDTVYCLIDEIEYIYISEAEALFKTGKLPSIPNVLILIARVLAFPMIGLQLAAISPDLADQTKITCFKALWYLLIVALANAVSIFVLRLIAIRSSRLPMKIFLWSVCAGIVGFFAYGVITARFNRSYFSVLPSIHTSQEEKDMQLLWRNWTITVSLIAAFDVIVFALTVATRFSGGTFIKAQSKVSEKFYFDSLQGFAITCSVSIIDLIWITRNRETGIFMAVVLPVQIFLALSIAPRVLRSLKLQVAKDKINLKRDTSLMNMPSVSKSNYSSPDVSPASQISALPPAPASGVLLHHTVVVESSSLPAR